MPGCGGIPGGGPMPAWQQQHSKRVDGRTAAYMFYTATLHMTKLMACDSHCLHPMQLQQRGDRF
jgi:hypothetical protein